LSAKRPSSRREFAMPGIIQKVLSSGSAAP